MGRGRAAGTRLALPSLGAAAAAGAMAVLAWRADGWVLDYATGLVPGVLPWLSACLSAVAAALLSGRRPAVVASLLAGVAVSTAWSVAMLPFDGLRLVRLVPLPVSGWGIALRLLLLGAATAVLVAGIAIDRARRGRCDRCRRGLPGRLARVPRWPAAVAVVFAAVYPALRTCWALGGTFGTAGDPLDIDPALAWGTAGAGLLLFLVAVVLLVGRGPAWLRAVLGLGAMGVGAALAAFGAPGVVGATRRLATGETEVPGLDTILAPWSFVAVYGSWAVAGLCLVVAGWRYWVHRRDACPVCRKSLVASP